MSVPKPSWFDRNKVMVSTAPTCGISKSGGLLAKYDSITGQKLEELDPETGEAIEAVDDQLLEDMIALRQKTETDTLSFIDRSDVSMRLAVPSYYDRRYHAAFTVAMQQPEFEGFNAIKLGDLVKDGWLEMRHGHGSALKDLRVGVVPYIKVSDLRAGLVNINPTNRVPVKWAEKMWRGTSSGLLAFDLLRIWYEITSRLPNQPQTVYDQPNHATVPSQNPTPHATPLQILERKRQTPICRS